MKKLMFNDKLRLTEAVINGTKTQTRRINKTTSLIEGWMELGFTEIKVRGKYMELHNLKTKTFIRYIVPYQVGEVVAVAQSYNDVEAHYREVLKGRWYEVDWEIKHGLRWENKGFSNKMFVKAEPMPHKIKITGVKVERLQDISDEDVKKEGLRLTMMMDRYYHIIGNDWRGDKHGLLSYDPRQAFASLIDDVSGKGTWESNPLVWVYEFELTTKK